MDKRELILTVAKDIMIAYKVMPKSRNQLKPENAISELGDLLSVMAKQVEQIYNEIKD
ncbi:MAG: hypothetical protein SVY10_10800 [Thermodesulfobacteriota bacterium]|nr:hypothetical protein [Thermodesulfobacteriota bacterium]